MNLFTLFNRKLNLRSALLIVALLSTPPSLLAEQTWTVNSKEMDINQLIVSVAKATNKTIIVDSKVKGKVKVISSTPMNKEQYYDLFLNILEVHGYAAVESGGVVRIIPAKAARTAPVPVVDTTKSENSQVVTQVIQLENVSASKLIPVLRPLAPQQAHMAAYAASNAIIISDTAANIARIRKIIKKIDLSALEKTEIVPLEHASAEEVVKMLEKLQKNQTTKGKPQNARLLVVADKRTNSLLINGDELERQRAKVLIKHLDTSLTQSGNVKVVYLEYGEAVELAKTLSKVVQNIEEMSTKHDVKSAKKSTATVEADEGTNSLIITAEADVMQSLLAVVERLDIRRAQVLVEAIIVEISAGNGRNLGIDWLFQDSHGGYGSSTDSGLAGGIVGASLDEDDETGVINTKGLAGALSNVTGQVLGYASLDKNFKFNVVLNALQTNNKANILSTPSLMTLDNEEASIVVAQKVPFTTGSYSSTGSGSSNPESPFQTVEREDVGVTLKITPQINEGDSLVLAITQEVSQVIQGSRDANGNVITTERSIETKVLADDGQTIVLGGLIDTNISESTQKVPLLGDIPFIGAMFRSSTTVHSKTHLMVFLRSTIVRDKKVMDAATAEKYRLIRNERVEEGEDGYRFFDDKELPMLPEWLEQIEELEKIRDEQKALEGAASIAAPVEG